MAKTTRGLQGQIAEIRAGKRAMDREARGDHGVVTSANKAGSANLRQQIGRAEARLDRVTARTEAGVKHLTQRAKQVQRQVRAREAANVSRYGTSLGASVQSQYAGARTAASTGVQSLQGARAVAARGANMAEGVVGIAKQGAKAQQAAGQYALNQALQARYAISAETAFQAEHEIRMAQLQAKLEMEQQKKLLKLQQKEEADALGGYAGASTAATAATEAAPELMELLNTSQGKDGEESYLTPAQAAQRYIDEYGVTDPNQAAMIRLMAQKMALAGAGFKQLADGTWDQRSGGIGGNIQPIIQTSMQQVFAQAYPQMWKKHKGDFMGIAQDAQGIWDARTAATAPTDPDGNPNYNSTTGTGSGMDLANEIGTRVIHQIPFVGPAMVRERAGLKLAADVNSGKSPSEIQAAFRQEFGNYLVVPTIEQIKAAIKKGGDLDYLIKDRENKGPLET